MKNTYTFYYEGSCEDDAKKMVSIDNGNTYYDSANDLREAVKDEGCWEWDVLWKTLADYMDDETREAVHIELAPCTDEEFLDRYLELAPCDLIIG